jgi:hypothetical protein
MNGLSVGDGFKFGCGFILAAFIAWLAVAIVGGIIMALFGAALGGIFGTLLKNVPTSGLLPALMGLI